MAGRNHELAARYAEVRATTERLVAPLSAEDMLLQSMPDASPAKWHLAHTTWFFEAFLQKPRGAPPFDPTFGLLFNSYYDALGERHARPERGMLSRPNLDEVRRYRAVIDGRVKEALDQGLGDADLNVVELGLHHEQQHQELILTDVLHGLSRNPTRPAYQAAPRAPERPAPEGLRFVAFDERLTRVGHAGPGFAFDNETPEHTVFCHAFELADRLSTNEELLAFVDDKGYERPELWLAEGFALAQAEGWRAPLYWERRGDSYHRFSLAGLHELDLAEPACHLSYYEADAFARYRGARLPTEFEWERAARSAGRSAPGNLLESAALKPLPAPRESSGIRQLFGDVWEWTSSAYAPYPGFRTLPGALGEYNGKFMVNQQVLRGGSFATSASHLRASYRNFFPARARWQFSGVRLAR